MDTNYGMEIVRATEIAALTAARLQGLGDHNDILNQTRKAIAKTLNRLRVEGIVVNDRFTNRPDTFQLPATIGKGGERTDLMAVALEAHHCAADGKNNATSYAVIAKEGSIQSLPNLSMYKIVVGPEVGQVIDINQPPTDVAPGSNLLTKARYLAVWPQLPAKKPIYTLAMVTLRKVSLLLLR